MENNTCSVPECDKVVKRYGYCYGHYMKNWRYGTPTPTHPDRFEDLTGRRFGTLIAVERRGLQWLCRCDCGRTRLALVGDLHRYEDDATCGDRRAHRRVDDAGYGAAHYRCVADRGPAKDHHCVDCGDAARHWSYDHDDPEELTQRVGRYEVAYSLDPSHYSPRCVPCHKRFDLNRIDSANRVA